MMEGEILNRFNVPSQADYSNLGQQVFTLFKDHDVLEVRDPATFISTFLNEGLDHVQHRLTRNLLVPAFSSKVIQEWEALAAPVAIEAMEAVAPGKRAD